MNFNKIVSIDGFMIEILNNFVYFWEDRNGRRGSRRMGKIFFIMGIFIIRVMRMGDDNDFNFFYIYWGSNIRRNRGF